MGLKIETKEDLKDLIKDLKELNLSEITLKADGLELTIKSFSPTFSLPTDGTYKKDDTKASASQILALFSKDIEEFKE